MARKPIGPQARGAQASGPGPWRASQRAQQAATEPNLTDAAGQSDASASGAARQDPARPGRDPGAAGHDLAGGYWEARDTRAD